MTITTVTSKEFNQDASGIKRAANRGPVFITDRGHLAHVLLKIEDYQKLTSSENNIIDQLSPSDKDDIEFEPTKLENKIFKQAHFE